MKICATRYVIDKHVSTDRTRQWLWKRCRTDAQHNKKRTFAEAFGGLDSVQYAAYEAKRKAEESAQKTQAAQANVMI